MSKELFCATATSINKLKIECSSRGFSFFLDEPKSLGGTDEGMNPVEALLATLGACKCIVAKSFAKSQKINLVNIQIRVEGELDTDGFTKKNKEAKIGFSKIISKYYINADNSDEEIQHFISFIEKTCPVLDTLINSPAFLTEVHLLK
ncbi:OsmC family protein [Providencia rettgeri]